MYAEARFEREVDEYLFRKYVADQVRLKAEGKYIPTEWHSIVYGERSKREDFDPEEIIDGLIERMNGGAK